MEDALASEELAIVEEAWFIAQNSWFVNLSATV
jgi:hypothetical protein